MLHRCFKKLTYCFDPFIAFIKAQPKKICSQIGLCAFDGSRDVRYLQFIVLCFVVSLPKEKKNTDIL